MKKHKSKMLTHAIRNGELVNVHNVENGLACNCICPNPNCKTPLIARNNPSNNKVAHFAHYKKDECASAFESALHLLAKEVIRKSKIIRTPNYYYDYEPKNSKSLYRNGKEVFFDEIIVEKAVHISNIYVIPDIIAIKDGKEVYIEFAKTHFIDNDKKNKIKRLNKPCIEIDIRKLDLDEEMIKEFLCSETIDSYWILNPRYDNEYQKECEEKEKAKEASREKERQKRQETLNNRQKRLDKYRKKSGIKILPVDNGFIKTCPLVRKPFEHLKQKEIYKNPIIKRIIDGEYWNRRIYGHNEKYIYLSNNIIEIYPKFELRLLQSEEESQYSKELYHGLNEILRSNNHVSHYKCNRCEYSIDYIELEKDTYKICSCPNT